ncbi:MAG: GIY-YIG nuclease family protein [Sphingobacteriaceae bacterium]|nr:GIY-YIG nuclease family protein [Sphingobacteriaceae bacterium]
MERFFVYILFSPILNRYYIGHTGQLSDRLFRHIHSGSKSTKAANDWKLVYKELLELLALFAVHSDTLHHKSMVLA